MAIDRKRSTTVFVAFLDASKADLTTGYYFEKLINRKVPLFIVMVFSPKDAYKMRKHFFEIILCV